MTDTSFDNKLSDDTSFDNKLLDITKNLTCMRRYEDKIILVKMHYDDTIDEAICEVSILQGDKETLYLKRSSRHALASRMTSMQKFISFESEILDIEDGLKIKDLNKKYNIWNEFYLAYYWIEKFLSQSYHEDYYDFEEYLDPILKLDNLTFATIYKTIQDMGQIVEMMYDNLSNELDNIVMSGSMEKYLS
jgi:hypothetical protein